MQHWANCKSSSSKLATHAFRLLLSSADQSLICFLKNMLLQMKMRTKVTWHYKMFLHLVFRFRKRWLWHVCVLLSLLTQLLYEPITFFGKLFGHLGWVSGPLLSCDAIFSSRNFCRQDLAIAYWSTARCVMISELFNNYFMSHVPYFKFEQLCIFFIDEQLNLILPRQKTQQNLITQRPKILNRKILVPPRHGDSLFWPFKPNSSLACHFSPSKWLLCCRS